MVNVEYKREYKLYNHSNYGTILYYEEMNFYYNWRPSSSERLFSYNPKSGYIKHIAYMPPRYNYSNTKEQLKSLFLI